MSKGDTPRPMSITILEYKRRWEKAFGKPTRRARRPAKTGAKSKAVRSAVEKLVEEK